MDSDELVTFGEIFGFNKILYCAYLLRKVGQSWCQCRFAQSFSHSLLSFLISTSKEAATRNKRGMPFSFWQNFFFLTEWWHDCNQSSNNQAIL